MRDMTESVASGRINPRENAIDAFLAVFSGENFGKMVVKL